jgi:polyphosphate kinase 2 (PPK2 family)
MNSPAVIVVEPHGKKQIEDYAKYIGLTCIRVFVDVDNQVQLDRLLRRFAADVSDIKMTDFRNKKLYDQTVAANAKRLVIATTDERVWLADAYERENGVLVNYDHIVKAFDSDTEKSVISQLELMIDSALAKPTQLEAA